MIAKKIALLLTIIFVLAQLPSGLRAQSNAAGENSFKSLHQQGIAKTGRDCIQKG
jgi:hypothetical protein